MNIPTDILLNEMYKYLSYDDLKKYSRTNNQIYNSTKEFKVWQYILMRDFGIEYSQHPQEEYILCQQALRFLNQYYKVITQKTLICFVKFIDKVLWKQLDEGLREEPSVVLTVFELIAIIEYCIDDLNKNYFIDDLLDIKQYINDTTDYHIIKEEYLKLKSHYKSDILPLINRPIYLYYNKELKKFQYDIDLFESLPLEYKNYEKLKNYISTTIYFQYV
jgi:hypothetical protein